MSDRSYTPELIADAIRGDDVALSFLYESTQDKVTQTVRSMIRDEDAVLDIVQDSFVKAFRNLDKLDKPEYFLAWMRRIATNTAVDYMKKKRPVLFSELASEDGTEIEFEDVDIGHLPDVLLDQQETSRLIQEIISGLSEEQQLAIGLFYFEEMPIKSIAKKLGCSENTVKSRLNYGRKNIEKQVRELEKKGTKLYSLAPLPFFLWLLRNLHSEPSQNMLGTVLAECADLSSGTAATANHAAAKAGAKAVSGTAKAGGKAVSSAAKKLTTKIVAGILAVATIGGGATIVLSGDSGDPAPTQEIADQTVVTTEEQQPTETTVPVPDPTAAYQQILDKIKDASRHPFEDGEYYYHFHEGEDLYYSRIDLDGNGVDELLIGRPGDIMDVFTFDGDSAQWILNRFAYNVSSEMTLMETGELYIEAPNGGDQTYLMFRLAENGYSSETVFSYVQPAGEEGTYYPLYENSVTALSEEEFQNLLGGYTLLTDIQWTQFTGPTEETMQNYQPILDEYTAACADPDYLEHRETYPNTINDGMYYYHAFGPSDLYYAFHDIDENGVYELLIGTPGDIWDAYTFDGEKPVKLVDIRALGGGRARLTIMDTGELYIYGASGADDVAYYMLRIGADGHSTESVFYFTYEYSEFGSSYQGMDGTEHVVLTEEEFSIKLSGYSEAYINWEMLVEAPMTATEAYQVVLDEYTAAAEAIHNDCFDPSQYTYAKDADIDIDSNGATGVHFGYCYRNIDQNGTKELIVGYTYEYAMVALLDEMQILNIYTFNGVQAVPLFLDRPMGDTVTLTLVNEGELYFADDRQDGGSYVLARIASDGYSLEVLYCYQTRLESGEVIYYNDTESYTEFEFRWAFPPLYFDNDIEWEVFTYFSDYWDD